MMALRKQDPFFASIFGDNDAFPLARSSSNELFKASAMRMNLKEDSKSYEATVEVPGISKEEIKVNVDENDVLTISAEHNVEKEKEDEKVHWHERSSGFMSRSIKLPEHVASDDINCKLADGILTVTIPKKTEEKKKVRQIQIE
mmetsp:Transcript_37291/g.52019  ORF Transcript_37291/g.52019 Transcript_37291/m.52019 type:complete len:144 (-) Transcript_37291:141-572(-)